MLLPEVQANFVLSREHMLPSREVSIRFFSVSISILPSSISYCYCYWSLFNEKSHLFQNISRLMLIQGSYFECRRFIIVILIKVFNEISHPVLSNSIQIAILPLYSLQLLSDTGFPFINDHTSQLFNSLISRTHYLFNPELKLAEGTVKTTPYSSNQNSALKKKISILPRIQTFNNTILQKSNFAISQLPLDDNHYVKTLSHWLVNNVLYRD